MPLFHLEEGAGFLWHHKRQWRIYQTHKRWQDGILAACCHPLSPHHIFLHHHQWVVGLVAEEPRAWLESLGPTWQAPTFSTTLYGRSMHPCFPPGTTITVAPLGPRPPRVGQVLVWAPPAPDKGAGTTSVAWVAHRLRAIASPPTAPPTYITRGDANRSDDPPLAHHQLIGRVLTAHHKGAARSLGNPTLQRARWHLVDLRQTIGRLRRK